MPLGYRLRSVKDKTDKELVLLRYRQVMTVVTRQAVVLALRPGIVRRLHQVTANAELRVVLGEIVELVGDESAAANGNNAAPIKRTIQLASTPKNSATPPPR